VSVIAQLEAGQLEVVGIGAAGYYLRWRPHAAGDR
jgi:hypothetical protein